MKLRFNSGGSASGSTRRETENGIEYLVANATIAREGVLDYSDQRNALDKELLPADEFTPASRWNGLPITVDHPTTATAGTIQPASTTTPGVSATDVGEFRDATTSSDGASLGGEVWIRANERDRHGPGFKRAFDALEGEDKVAVSPGYGVGTLDETDGRHNGQNYSGVQRDLDPDHVAVVINGKARCTVSQGCSIGERANAQPDGGASVDSAAFGTPLVQSETNDMTTRQNATLFQRARDAYNALGDVLGANTRHNALAEARTPEYDSTLAEDDISDGEFVSTHWMLDDYIDAYAEETGEDVPEDVHSALSEGLSQEAREWIAGHTLLGNADAETEPNLLLFDVVSPDGVLHESELKDILGSDGARATLPENVRESARDEAQSLLDEEFGEDTRQNAEKQRVKWESENGDTRYGLIADELEDDDQPDDKVLVAMYEYAPDEESESEKDDWQPMTDEDGDDQNARVDRDKLTEIEKFPSSPGRENAGEETAQDGDEPAESGRDADSTQTDTDMTDPDTDDPTDEQMIDYLAEETDIDRKNAEQWRGEDCLSVTYEQFRDNAESEDGDGEDNPDDSDPDAEPEDEEPAESDEERENSETYTDEELREKFEEWSDERENAKQQESLIGWIDSRSERYNAEKLEGASPELLEEIADEVAEERENAGPGASTSSPPQADRSAMQTGGPVRENAERGEAPDVAVGGDPWGEQNSGEEADD